MSRRRTPRAVPGDHVDARSTDAHRYKPGPGTRVQIRYLVMHDAPARLPKRLTRNDLSRLITLEEWRHRPRLDRIQPLRPLGDRIEIANCVQRDEAEA